MTVQRKLLMSALFAALSLAPLMAQEFRATLQGSVADQSDARIPGAQVTLTNTGTGVVQTTSANESGLYVFQFLAPGAYRLEATSEGFKTNVVDNIQLSVGQNQRVDISLELGAVTETVEVTTELNLIQTDEVSTGATIRAEIKDNLPIKGRSSLTMFSLAPGVVNNRFGEDTRPNDTITNVLFSANGSPVASGDVAVDGAVNTVNVNRDVNISQWVPAVDAVGEFKLQTGILPAEFGRAAGSFMNIVIKSGTNELHGSLYEYFRNSALDANNFFARGQGQDLAAFGANTFGVTVGAPIVKNRTFGFFSYEGAREGNGLNRRATVPTSLMRAGDFSEVNRPLYDPFSVEMVNGAPTRTGFANNVIPPLSSTRSAATSVGFLPGREHGAAERCAAMGQQLHVLGQVAPRLQLLHRQGRSPLFRQLDDVRARQPRHRHADLPARVRRDRLAGTQRRQPAALWGLGGQHDPDQPAYDRRCAHRLHLGHRGPAAVLGRL